MLMVIPGSYVTRLEPETSSDAVMTDPASQSRVLAIDPGPTHSAILGLDTTTGRVLPDFGYMENGDVVDVLRGLARSDLTGCIVIEKIEGMGMAVGAETFETVYWSGRFAEAARPLTVERVTRRAVKLHLCGSMRAKDANVRQALIDRYGGATAKGTKKKPGPLYGVSGDVWSALAVAVTYADSLT
jgi:hypothetical protein